MDGDSRDRLINQQNQNSYNSVNSVSSSSPELSPPPQQPPGRIPTPTGPTKFNMTFTFSLFATVGSALFAGTVWYIMFSANYIYFIWHPILMSTTLLLVTHGILVLQTATKKEEKESGVNWHRIIQSIAFLCIIGGFSIIYSFKNSNLKDHFTSEHSKAGLITLTLILVQTTAGAILYNLPGLVGGVAKARGMYKYHRLSGYVGLLFIYITALGGTQSEWVKNQFDHFWVWLAAIGLVLVGIVGRTKGSKLKVW